jgi:hypothetical protein
MTDYAVSRPLQQRVMQGKKAKRSMSGRDVAEVAARQKAQGLILKGAHQGAKYAARSQMKGYAGVALRVTGRIGLRAIPVVGAAMLAYDLYQAYEYLTE